ncbi:hypothetical protein GCM10027051_21490 [Niabella terrae]
MDNYSIDCDWGLVSLEQQKFNADDYQTESDPDGLSADAAVHREKTATPGGGDPRTGILL